MIDAPATAPPMLRPSPRRVVSLLPAATEIVALLGLADRLVGRSHECDTPPGVAGLPAVTATTLPPASVPDAPDCVAIDAAVAAAHAQGRPLDTLDVDRLAALAPDLIITQDLCDVCSIDLGQVRRAALALTPAPGILSLNPHTVEGVLDDVLRIADALGEPRRGADAVVRLRERLFAASEFVNPFADGPVAALLEWTDPPFIAGHWNVQLIERAGARHPLNPSIPVPNAGAAAGPQQAERRAGRSFRIAPDALRDLAPEVLIIAPCGLNLAQTRHAAASLANLPWWPDLPAVRARRVALVDGQQMFNRPGPRVVDAFEFLVGYLHDRPALIPPHFPWAPLLG